MEKALHQNRFYGKSQGKEKPNTPNQRQRQKKRLINTRQKNNMKL